MVITDLRRYTWGGGSVLPALLQLLNRFPPPPPPPPPGFCCHGKKVFFGCEGGWGCGEGSQRKFSLHGNKNREGNIFFQQDNFFLSIEVISTQRNISSWIDKHFLPSKKTFPFTNFFLGQCTLKYGFSKKVLGTFLVITPLLFIRFSKFKLQTHHRNLGYLFGKF